MKQLFKKSIFIFLILMELSTVSLMAGEPVVLTNSEEKAKVDSEFRPRVTFSFTIARRRDCLGFGICDFSFDVTLGRVNSCIGTMYADVSSKNTVIIEIDKNSGIKPESYSKYFSSGKFLMEDETPIPNDILKELGLSGSKTLQAGNHKVTERNGKLYVAIPVR